MDTIALIGAGQIGSRHLQGLSLATRSLQVIVVEPDDAARALAAERLREMPNGGRLNVKYTATLHALPQEIDLAIIATSSGVRYRVLSETLAASSVQNIVLEKFLFPKLDDYDSAAQLLARTECKAWVNCPRRMMATFRELPALLPQEGDWSFAASGSNWGMGSNAIHLLDNYAMYTGTTAYKIDASGLDPTTLQSKRSGYIELTGTLIGEFSTGARFSISCDSGENWQFINEFSRASATVVCDFAKQNLTVQGADGEVVSEQQLLIDLQGEMTGRLVDQILSSGDCVLPSYAESSALHLPLLRAISAVQAQNSNVSSEGLFIT